MGLHRHLIHSLIALTTLFSTAHAADQTVDIESVTRITNTPELYRRVDFVVMLHGQWHDPYASTDIMLDLVLQSPSGKKVIVPAYYERGASGASSVWNVRFAPREKGTYKGRFVLKNHTMRESAPVSFDVAPTADRGFLHTDGLWVLRFDNGIPFRGIGENIGWEARAFDDSRHFKSLHENQRYHYEYMLGTLARNGGNFFRTWMCAWNLPLEWKQVTDTSRYTNDTAHFNASAMQRMDELVELAARTDTYFMLALDPHGSLLGNGWDLNPYNVKNGGKAATPTDFFSNEDARLQYKDRLRYLVARWGYSPNLGVWEFFNEVDNAMYNHTTQRIPDDVVVAWHAEMSDFLKRLDPYERVVTTSISHRDVQGLTAIPTLDLNQRHIYDRTDTIPDVIRRFTKETGKPYVIGEYSYEWDWQKNFDDFADQMDADFKSGLWFGLFSPTPILPMTWWWEYFDNRKTTVYFNRVKKVLDQMMAAGGGSFNEISPTWDGPALGHLLGVKCGQKLFVLLHGPKQGESAGKVALPMSAPGQISAQVYDPESDQIRDISAAQSGQNAVISLRVPAGADVILIVTAP